MADPIISIVMPSYNQGDYIEEAIHSVLSQSYANKELIVVDGGSTDGTLNILQRYANYFSYWVSESDQGQSDALNKGFAKASGDIVAWLNSDDILLPNALSKVANAIKLWRGKDNFWIAGGCAWIDHDGYVLNCSRARKWCVNAVNNGVISVFGPSSFFSRALINEVGGIDKSFHYSMDTELWFRFARYGIRFSIVPGYLWALRLHPAAKVSGGSFSESPMSDPNHPARVRRREEASLILQRHGCSTRDQRIGKASHTLCSTLALAAWQSRFDSWWYRDKHWSSLPQ